MTNLAFAMAVFTLLVLPGPTNALLALSSQGLTLLRAARLIAVVLCAYLAVMLPVCLLAGPYLAGHPMALQALKLAAAGWVFYLAVRLWRASAAGGSPSPATASLFATTLLNPKGLIIGLTLMPQAEMADLAGRVALVLAVAALTSGLWLGLGRLLLAGQRQKTVGRCGSALLACFGLVLTASAF